jgi:hypothetical protein
MIIHVFELDRGELKEYAAHLRGSSQDPSGSFYRRLCGLLGEDTESFCFWVDCSDLRTRGQAVFQLELQPQNLRLPYKQASFYIEGFDLAQKRPSLGKTLLIHL